eukprot:TCONS_00023201-protein
MLNVKFFFGTSLIFSFLVIWRMMTNLSLKDQLDVYSKTELYFVSNDKFIRRKIYSNERLELSPKNISDYGDGTCKENPYAPIVQKLFRSWDAFTKEHGIVYALHDGSLLAAYRDGHLIPYDSDADVLISFEDLEKLERKLGDQRRYFSRKNKNMTYFIIQKDWRMPENVRRRINCESVQVSRMEDSCSFMEPIGRFVSPGVLKSDGHMAYVDVFAYVNHYDTMYLQDDFNVQVRVKDVFPLKKCSFLGVETWCPRNPSKLLK